MATRNTLLLSLTKGLFWNSDVEKLDYLRDKDYIIKRIIEAGLENDEIIMWKLYPFEDIKNIALSIENLHKDKIIYMSFVLNIKEDEFICCKKKQWYQK
jgi:hypothetical protein